MGLSIIILAAGQGTRMRSELPKVLQPLAGKPLLAHVLACAEELSAADVCVVYGHGGGTVQAAFPGKNLRWALQAEQLGTGHAVQQAAPETPDANRVLILAGDVPLLTAATLRNLLEETPDDEMSVLTVDMDDPSGYGRIIREGGGVKSIVEQKDATDEQKAIREINTGVILCPGDKLKGWLNALGNDNAQGEYYLTDVIAMAVADKVMVHGVKANSAKEVMGINDKKQLRDVFVLMYTGRGAEVPEKLGNVSASVSTPKNVLFTLSGAIKSGLSRVSTIGEPKTSNKILVVPEDE